MIRMFNNDEDTIDTIEPRVEHIGQLLGIHNLLEECKKDDNWCCREICGIPFDS